MSLPLEIGPREELRGSFLGGKKGGGGGERGGRILHLSALPWRGNIGLCLSLEERRGKKGEEGRSIARFNEGNVKVRPRPSLKATKRKKKETPTRSHSWKGGVP